VTALQSKLLPTLDYLLHEWLGLGALLARERFAGHDRSVLDELLHATSDIAEKYFESANRTVDSREPYVQDGKVVLPPETQAAWDAITESGFLAAAHDEEDGGMQLPRAIQFAGTVIICASSVGISPGALAEGNASLLITHGTPTQREVFARRELTGQWAGTMCLSETQAGSSLADVTTRAVPDGDDSETDPLGPRYRITGNKMWISAGDHELTENIVHLVLAKIPNEDGTVDPSTKGISLFIVPKVLVAPDGSLRERNDVSLIGLNHKLGFHALTNCALAFGDGTFTPRGAKGAIGYLVGAPGDGLRQMFHMMNSARITVGLAAASLGFAGYSASLEYAQTRLQGRHITKSGTDAAAPPVPIIEHADVKRMLLAQKAYAEGAIALGLYAARLLDEQKTGSPQEAAEAKQLLDILTPVVKSWPSQWCLEGNSLAIQVLGGAGYTRDFPVEQYWRDNRLNMIYEGTHGIQAQDLLGRKVIKGNGADLQVLGAKVEATVAKAREVGLTAEADALEAMAQQAVMTVMGVWANADPQEALPNATLFLQGFGHTVLAWIWLDIAISALASTHPEAPGKIAAMKYFFAYELPLAKTWFKVVASKENLCRDLDPGVL
jgi:butyryl-CoA dehydrogenase